MDHADRIVKRPLFTTTTWAILFSVAGSIAVFLPWTAFTGKLPPGGIHFEGLGLPRGIDEVLRQLTPSDYGKSFNGLTTWHGIPTGVTFVVMFLLLVATSPLYPVPLWRSIVLFVAGGLVLLFTGLFVGRFVGNPLFALQAGAYLALGLGFGLLFLGALEIRELLLRRLRAGRNMVPLEPEIAPAKYRDERPPRRAETEEKDRFKDEI